MSLTQVGDFFVYLLFYEQLRKFILDSANKVYYKCFWMGVMINTGKKYCPKILLLVALLACFTWADSTKVQLLTKRYRTEWNWVEYRITLKNISNMPILNPEIRYFAQNTWIQYCEERPNNGWCASVQNGEAEKDTMLELKVDNSSSLNPVTESIVSSGKITVAKMNFHGLLYPGKTVNVNFRVHKKNWSAWNSKDDWSFQHRQGVLEQNYFFAVYDNNLNLLWGSDPLSEKSKANVELWNDRNGNYAIGPYDGNTTEIQKSGRFWMIKDAPLNRKEKKLLEQAGARKLSASARGERSLILLKSDVDIRKKMLDSLVYGFYNSFSADDTTRIKAPVEPEDWNGEELVCDASGACHMEVSVLTSIPMITRCWNDVEIPACKDVVESCGGTEAVIDNYIIVSNNSRDAINCLERAHDVRSLDVIRQAAVDNNTGRRAVNIDYLQTSTWNIDFTGLSDSLDESWLSGQKYTGEHVVVGVYDTGIYFDHDAMNEWINGEKKARKAFNNAVHVENGRLGGSGYYSHATHVAGIVGGNGNGNGSPNHIYRGVAPKVKFFSGDRNVMNQRGHVVNHSHVGTYDIDSEMNLFKNWVDNTEDPTPKTFVASSGNAAKNRGFYSITYDTKNGIVVGNYVSRTKFPNTNSSYGPTLDGRIKPDLMAPGSGFQGSFDVSNPFVAYLDYLRINRNGMEIKFAEKPLLANQAYIDESEYSYRLDFVDDLKASGGKALKIIHENPLSEGFYITWKYGAFSDLPFEVKKDDIVTIRMRLPENILALYPVMHGNIYLASGDKFGSGQQLVEFNWNFGKYDGEYYETSFRWTGTDIVSKYLRISFGYDYGIFSSVPCTRDSGGTCYEDESGTSMAAPYVSGIAALMNQAYMEKMGDTSYTKSLRNSTSKAILIHTADDMVDEVGFARSVEYDVRATTGKDVHVVYGKGPDYVTGWGGVNAKKALSMFDTYDYKNKKFKNFEEFEIADASKKKWTVNVDGFMDRLRVTLAWDDSPGEERGTGKNKKLQNDLDMYLISPSGRNHFPWRLKPRSTECLEKRRDGRCKNEYTRITEEDARRPAERGCGDGVILLWDCFDHLNNVEVVDVDLPERGIWTVVVRARIEEGNSKDSLSQIASIVSDLPLEGNPNHVGCEIVHPYMPQSLLNCVYDFGSNLANYVTFSPQTFVGPGDTIRLRDAEDAIIGAYTGDQLAGKRMKIDSRRLMVELESSKAPNFDYGFSVDKIETVPYPMFFGITQ